jgi:hypothetical protein
MRRWRGRLTPSTFYLLTFYLLRMGFTATRCTCSHLRVYLALLPSGPDAVRRLGLHRVRAAMQPTNESVYRTGASS